MSKSESQASVLDVYLATYGYVDSTGMIRGMSSEALGELKQFTQWLELRFTIENKFETPVEEGPDFVVDPTKGTKDQPIVWSWRELRAASSSEIANLNHVHVADSANVWCVKDRWASCSGKPIEIRTSTELL